MMALTFLVQGNTSYLPCYVVRLSPFVSILSDLIQMVKNKEVFHSI